MLNYICELNLDFSLGSKPKFYEVCPKYYKKRDMEK